MQFEPRQRELEPRGEERASETAAGEIRPEAETDFDSLLVLRLEREVADEFIGLVAYRPVGLAAGLEFARTRFEPARFVLSVATFNERAIKVYERAGFSRERTYMHSTNGGEWEFLEMSRPV